MVEHVEYYQEDVLPELDIERDVVTEWGFGKKDGLMKTIDKNWDKLYPIVGLVIVGAVLIYAFATGGGS